MTGESARSPSCSGLGPSVTVTNIMTKADVVESVCKEAGFSKKESAEIVEMVFDTIKDTLERAEKIKLSGFGNFIVREKKSRVGRNPKTGTRVEVPAKKIPYFKPSKELKDVVNVGGVPGDTPVDITSL